MKAGQVPPLEADGLSSAGTYRVANLLQRFSRGFCFTECCLAGPMLLFLAPSRSPEQQGNCISRITTAALLGRLVKLGL